MARSDFYMTKSHLLRRLLKDQAERAGPVPRQPQPALPSAAHAPSEATDIATRLDRHATTVSRHSRSLEGEGERLLRRSMAQHELREETVHHLLSECRALEGLLEQTIARSREQHERVRQESVSVVESIRGSERRLSEQFENLKSDLASDRVPVAAAKTLAAESATRARHEQDEINAHVATMREHLDLRNETFHDRSRAFETALATLTDQARALLMEPADQETPVPHQTASPGETTPSVRYSHRVVVPQPAPAGFRAPLTPPGRPRSVPIVMAGIGRRVLPSMFVGLSLLALFLATAFGVLLAAA